MNKEIHTYGAELEKAIADKKTGMPHRASQVVFESLGEQAQQRGTFEHFHESDLQTEVKLGAISTDLGDQGVDNAFNLLETALPYQQSLTELNALMQQDLQTVQTALEAEGAAVVNLSIHPLGKRDPETYKTFVAPKGVYPYIIWRGWDHSAGIDARAQNSPATGVDVHDAARAVTTIIGAGPAFIGLFANSPYEEGKRSPYKEARLTMWDRMMGGSKVQGDLDTAKFPDKPFTTLAEYFQWMHGQNTGIHFVIASGDASQYKSIGDRILVVKGNPSVLDYLSQAEWEATFLKDLQGQAGEPQNVQVVPHISHMETMQFAQFAGARVRYGLQDHDNFPLDEFVAACQTPTSTKVEQIFEKFAKYTYIEGRDPGANFPDAQLRAYGDDVAQSVMIAPSALQAGLMQNLDAAHAYIQNIPWEQLKALREQAVTHGLQGQAGDMTVHGFAKKILELAADGLRTEEQVMLGYPEWVIKTGQNGADRAIKFVEEQKTSEEKALVNLVKSRVVTI